MWSNTRYVRIPADEIDMWSMSWKARVVFIMLLRLFNSRGIYKTKTPLHEVLGIPDEICSPGLSELVKKRIFKLNINGVIIFEDYHVSQNAVITSAQRQKNYRWRHDNEN